MIVYVSISNSDDKLSQADWASFVEEVACYLEAKSHIHGAWFSEARSPYQNACWCVEMVQPVAAMLKKSLIKLAEKYQQDSIAWAEAPVTRFLGQPEDD